MIARLNRLVFESSAPNRYARFFPGTYDAASRVLRYVNAGHNPPIVIRANDKVLRLEASGSVVGLLDDGAWVMGEVRLERGDFLVAFTDGVSEAMNELDEEWGEERLLCAICESPGARPALLVHQIIRMADEFVAGAPQFEDMTLIVARVD